MGVNIDSSLFNALLNVDIDHLVGRDISDVLPYLTNLLLSPSFVKRQQLIRVLHPVKKTNDLLHFMTPRCFEYTELSQLMHLSFESCSCIDRLKIVAAEYIKIQELARHAIVPVHNQSQPEPKMVQSELFDNPIYIDDVSYCLSTLVMKTTNIPMINLLDMCEVLLHVKFGITYIVRLVVNVPDRCLEVCQSLISFGERLDEGPTMNGISDQRAKTLRLLCLMNPPISFTLRSTTLQLCKLPSLTVMITLDNLNKVFNHYDDLIKRTRSDGSDSGTPMEVDNQEDIQEALKNLEDCFDSTIAFINGIFLGSDEDTRTWFAQYTKSVQLKRIDHNIHSVLSNLRSQLLACINVLFPNLQDEQDFYIRDENETQVKKKALPKGPPKGLNKRLIRATATLRLYCTLRGIGLIKLNAEEIDLLMRLITCKAAIVSPSVINFATTGVCSLLVCSGLIGSQKEEKRAAEWLRWLIKESNQSDGAIVSQAKSSLSEILLLVAIHFLNSQVNQIADLVCTTLGMRLQIKTSVSKCRTLFVQEVFNDQMVAEHAVNVPVTVNLNNHMTEFLPVHCVHQLLESRSFSKHQISIQYWIMKQIRQATKPLHHMMPKLIEVYVNSVIIPTTPHGRCGTNQCIAEIDLARIFKIKLYSEPYRDKLVKTEGECENHLKGVAEEDVIADPEVSQILLLYYLLLYEEIRLRKNTDVTPADRAKLVKYSADFMFEVPIFYLVQRAREDQDSFGVVLPELIRLVTLQYPQLCSIQHWLNLEPTCIEVESGDLLPNGAPPSSTPAAMKRSTRKKQSFEERKQNLLIQMRQDFDRSEMDMRPLNRTLNQILLLDREEIWLFVQSFIENLPRILGLDSENSIEYRQLIQTVTKLWWKLNNIFPRKLWVMTVNALRRPQNLNALQTELEPVVYTGDELVIDPLIVLRCDERVFRCVEMLNIVLHILSAFLAASRRTLYDQINEQTKQKDRGLEELRVTLMHAQTSAAIQILLEACLPDKAEQRCLIKQEDGLKLEPEEKFLLNRLDANIDCVCEHLHQVFIADINLAKLVHFQTYPSELLTITTDRVPSMHICLDFIPELISQPDLEKQVFVIELTSHLCVKYAITKSLNVAKLCFGVSFTMLQLLPSERRALFFIPILPALLRICKVFPILREDASIILNQIKQVTSAHLASTSSHLCLGSAEPFQGLEGLSWRQVNEIMNRLGLNEALYLCIHKCQSELNNLS